jgi:hypothetical protein
MTEPTFKPGDIVEFEESKDYPGLPRWLCNEDRGSTGKWLKGTFVQDTIERLYWFHIEGFSDNTYWCVPSSGHNEYSEDQWDRPGFIKLPNISNKVRLIDMGGYYATVPSSKPIGGEQRSVTISKNLIDWC